eukprot:172941_1
MMFFFCNHSTCVLITNSTSFTKFMKYKIVIFYIVVVCLLTNSMTQEEKKSKECVSKLMELTTKNGIKVIGAFIDNLSLPLLIYRNVFDKSIQKKKVSSHLAKYNWTANSWSWGSGASPTPHYHDNCHETLIVLRGSANIKWGKNCDISGTAYAGDVIFQPSGCYHAGNGCSNDCVTMGVYPKGSPQWEFAYNGPNKKQMESIK